MGQFLNSIFVMFSEGGQAKKTRNLRCRSFGGDKRDRTADLLNAIQALSQLSYTPIFGFVLTSWPVVLTGDVSYYSRGGGKCQQVFSKNLADRAGPAGGAPAD